MPFHNQGQLGELAETTPLLRVRTLTGTEGSNPSLSATAFFSKKSIIFHIDSEQILSG